MRNKLTRPIKLQATLKECTWTPGECREHFWFFFFFSYLILANFKYTELYNLVNNLLSFSILSQQIVKSDSFYPFAFKHAKYQLSCYCRPGGKYVEGWVCPNHLLQKIGFSNKLLDPTNFKPIPTGLRVW